MEKISYRNLKDILSTLNESQLDQPVYVVDDDSEQALPLDEVEITKEDTYWDHCDLHGTLETIKEENSDDWEDVIADLNKIPKGTVYLLFNRPDPAPAEGI